ncbi:N-acetylglucosaminidase [Marinilactibacillus psychrotolerans]|nr:N-acetylglucosaminidase [Marinilactibacillus psychrotolerans]
MIKEDNKMRVRKVDDMQSKKLIKSIFLSSIASMILFNSDVNAEDSTLTSDNNDNFEINDFSQISSLVSEKQLDWKLLGAIKEHQNEEYISALKLYNEYIDLNDLTVELKDEVLYLIELAETNQTPPVEFDIFLKEFNEGKQKEDDNVDDISKQRTSDELELESEKQPSEEIKEDMPDINKDDKSNSTTKDVIEDESENEKNQQDKETTNSVSARSTAVLSADSMYSDFINASTATKAWNAAQEFKNNYPNDSRLKEVFIKIEKRILDLAQSYHRKGNYNSALTLYKQLKNESMISGETKNLIEEYLNLINKSKKLPYLSTLYSDTINASTASEAWGSAMNFKKYYPNDELLIQAIEDAAKRILNLGQSYHRKGELVKAKELYDKILDEPLVNSILNKSVELSFLQAKNGQKLSYVTTLFNDTINAKTASRAWDLALYFLNLYPTENKAFKALEISANRIFSLGQSYHRKGDFNKALHYYNLLINESRISDSLEQSVKQYVEQADGKIDLVTDNDYKNKSIKAKTASKAWEIALEGKANFPNSELILDAVISAADRLIALGKNAHSSKEYDKAISYYEMVLNESLVPFSYKSVLEVYIMQAKSQFPNMNSEKIYKKSLSANTASEAWNLSIKGLEFYPNNSLLLDSLEQAGLRVFSLGKSNHRKGNFDIATTYYNMIVGNPSLPSYLIARASSYLYLSNNNMFLTSYVIKGTQYKSSFSEALSKQMNNNPQTDLNGNGFSKATTEQTKYYLNPENFLPENSNDIDVMLSTLKVITKTLNVRTGPSTNYTNIGQVEKNQSFQILSSQNGWFEINFNGRNAWISGSQNYVKVDNDVLQFLKLSGSSGISVNDMNKELASAGILKNMGSVFSKASQTYNINEIYLISHALLETGYGTSELATGVKVNGVTVYNMFGIGAYDSNAVKLGAQRAYELGWTTPEKAILGGAKWISNQYINNSIYLQDTLYKMRWNPSMPSIHQYATDIGWAVKQTNSLDLLVRLSQKYDLVLNFDVPIYK